MIEIGSNAKDVIQWTLIVIALIAYFYFMSKD